MKVLHIASSDGWGAGTAAVRLHQGLLRQGSSSAFLCLNKTTPVEDVHQYPRLIPLPLWKRALRKLGIPVTRKEKNNDCLQGLKGQYEAFTFPLTDYNILTHDLVRKADIINLHWIANFVDLPTFFAGINKPVVWTLHDMNPFLGGFHYYEDVVRNEAIMGPLEMKMRAIKQRALSSFERLTIVTPSKWLLERSRQSETLGKFPHHHIPYGLDLEIFRPADRKQMKEKLGIPSSQKLVLFISEDVNNHRKGFDLLLEAIAASSFGDEVLFGAVGTWRQNNEPPAHVKLFGRIQDPGQLAELYSAADLFILPSREDNFPNVMLEALACGTPVLSFADGGMADIIRTGSNGILLDEISPRSLLNGLEVFFSGKYEFGRDAIRSFAMDNFSLERQADRYRSLYESILKNN
jgi:glycosyltransferase involved in cell wall biosynthesis